MSISPFQMKNLLYYIISGKEFEFEFKEGRSYLFIISNKYCYVIVYHFLWQFFITYFL